jgi:hypothetical protein
MQAFENKIRGELHLLNRPESAKTLACTGFGKI